MMIWRVQSPIIEFEGRSLKFSFLVKVVS